jgi:hypothetical protein
MRQNESLGPTLSGVDPNERGLLRNLRQHQRLRWLDLG